MVESVNAFDGKGNDFVGKLGVILRTEVKNCGDSLVFIPIHEDSSIKLEI